MSDYADEMDERGQDHDLRTGDRQERVKALIEQARRHLHTPPPADGARFWCDWCEGKGENLRTGVACPHCN